MDKLTVTQADRDAAKGWFCGMCDDSQMRRDLAQAFAMHRIAQIKALKNPAPELVEAVCQARLYSDHPDMRWDDVVTEGVAVIERMIAERILTAVAAYLLQKTQMNAAVVKLDLTTELE